MKVPECDAWSVGRRCQKAMLGVLEEGAGKRCSECWRKVPESDALSVRTNMALSPSPSLLQNFSVMFFDSASLNYSYNEIALM